MNLRNLKLKPRLFLTFGVMALVFGAAVALGVMRLTAFNRAVQVLTGQSVPHVEQTDGWLLDVMDVARRTRSMVIRDKDHVQEEIDGAKRALADRKKLEEAAIAAAVTPEEKAALKPVVEAEDATAPLEAEYLRLFEAGRKADAVALMDAKMRGAEHSLLDVFKAYREFQNAAVQARADTLAATYRASMVQLLVLSGIALLVGAVLAFVTAQGMAKRMERIIRHFETFAAGDFKQEIAVDSADEIGQVLEALRFTQKSLGEAAEAAADYQSQIAAIGRAQAVIEFGLDGAITTANENYLKMIGYSVEELRGKSVTTLLDNSSRTAEDNRRFLEKLARGEHEQGVQKRIGKGGREIWIQASVNPILNAAGQPYRAITYATDVTEQVNSAAEFKGQITAINRVQAVVEFKLDGTIITANDNFLKTVGYTLQEIRGQHHSMLVDPEYRSSDKYRAFWEKLARGEFDAGQYRRIAKGGREIWIQASYNPILDAEGKPYKVVKYATDITEHMKAAENARIKTALDKAGSSVMLADDKLKVIYMNEAAQKLFRDMQSDLRRDLPQFDAANLMGSSVESLHKRPGEQRALLTGLRATHTEQLDLGGRVVRIAASPVLDADGKRVGTVVEWADRTQEVAVEQEVATIVSKALEGDLSERLATAGKSGFFEKLATGLNQLLENTGQMVRQIKTAASAVHRGAEEISQGNANLSQRTEEQSSSLEETASSMEEMTSTVKQNADNAGQANQLATAARDQAEKGGAVVGKAVRAMSDINDASKKIADIIGVIDEIAFQTNLLALNAAVEAARAGEQGRGFAVVATEVRSLAGRSATAAKEIKDLIQDSVRKVEDGTALVTQSGQTLEQIVASVKKVSDIVAEIAAASREQSSGIEQVNKAVMQMDEMTQQNAALVEQATAASQSMAEQASELNTRMARYQIAGGDEPAAAERSVERRGTERPWSERGAKAPKAAAPKAARAAAAPPAAKAANGGDTEWQDF